MATILVIEADKRLHKAFRDLLELEGHTVYIVEDAEIGLERAREHLPHLILGDKEMPKRNAIDLMTTLRADPQTSEIGFMYKNLRDEYDDYYPISYSDQDDIRVRIEAALQRLAKRRQPYARWREIAPQKVILVVAHTEFLREGLRDVLAIEGYTVEMAADGQNGVDRAREHLPNLILCDSPIPVLDAVAVYETLRADPPTRRIPFLFMTGRSDPAHEKIQALGHDNYVIKPFDVEDLRRMINERLRQQDRYDGGKCCFTGKYTLEDNVRYGPHSEKRQD